MLLAQSNHFPMLFVALETVTIGFYILVSYAGRARPHPRGRAQVPDSRGPQLGAPPLRDRAPLWGRRKPVPAGPGPPRPMLRGPGRLPRRQSPQLHGFGRRRPRSSPASPSRSGRFPSRSGSPTSTRAPRPRSPRSSRCPPRPRDLSCCWRWSRFCRPTTGWSTPVLSVDGGGHDPLRQSGRADPAQRQAADRPLRGLPRGLPPGRGRRRRAVPLAVGAVYFYLFAYLIASFAVFGVMAHLAGPDDADQDLEHYAGLAKENPFLARGPRGRGSGRSRASRRWPDSSASSSSLSRPSRPGSTGSWPWRWPGW